MGENVFVLIEQMKMFATLMALGFVAFKIKLINDNNTDNISLLLTRLILPLMIGTSIGSSNRDGIFSMGIFISKHRT